MSTSWKITVLVLACVAMLVMATDENAEGNPALTTQTSAGEAGEAGEDRATAMVSVAGDVSEIDDIVEPLVLSDDDSEAGTTEKVVELEDQREEGAKDDEQTEQGEEGKDEGAKFNIADSHPESGEEDETSSGLDDPSLDSELEY